MTVKDLFGNELSIGDQVVNVLIYKNEANFRKGIIEAIEVSQRGTLVYVRNAETHRKTVKITSGKEKYVCKDILKYDWKQYETTDQLSLFPELF